MNRFSFSRCFASLLFTCTALVGPNLFAQVKATLVATETSIQPGHPLQAALRLTHDPHWHTYWVNAGTGYPTKLTWQLPEGWTASEIAWPAPIVIKDHAGNVTGNGYDGEILLLVTLTPPKSLPPGQPVVLRAKAEWLMCNETCVPGEAEVSLSLPVSASTPAVDDQQSAAFANLPLPKPLAGWTAAAVQNGKNIVLTLSGGSAALPNPHFFSSDELIQYDMPQAVSATNDGVRLVLPVSPAFEGKPVKLIGVLTFGESAAQRRGVTIETELKATPTITATPPPSTSLLPTLVLALVGGLILNLMPCVFPVLGIKIIGFVNQSGAERKKITLHGIVFSLGVLASFWALAAVLAILRAGGAELGWGFQLQSPAFVFILAAVMLVFALSMSGVFDFGLRATSIGSDLQSKSGYTGSFLTGVLATVVATPCSAPFLAPALGAALALSTAASFAIFTTIAIGLSTPYLLLSIFPGAVKILPRPGAWMETFKQAMAFPLYWTVGYLVWVLAGQVGDSGLLNVLIGLTLVAMSAWLYGRYTAPGSKPARVRFGFVGGAVLLGLGALLGWPRAAEPTDIVWEKWTPAAVASAQQAGKTVYVDFTARWCATCQANKRLVFGSAEVKSLFRDRGVVTLEGDWTNHDPAITAELAKFGRSAVPFNLIYKPGIAEPVALPELLTSATVLNALR
jgi:thiol:disulfide interchange protein DsbD